MRFLSLWHGDTLVRSGITMSSVVGALAAERGVTMDELKGPSRVRSIAHARQDAMAACRALGCWSYPQIGRFFNRDHTTVLHGVRAHQARALAEQVGA